MCFFFNGTGGNQQQSKTTGQPNPRHSRTADGRTCFVNGGAGETLEPGSPCTPGSPGGPCQGRAGHRPPRHTRARRPQLPQHFPPRTSLPAPHFRGWGSPGSPQTGGEAALGAGRAFPRPHKVPPPRHLLHNTTGDRSGSLTSRPIAQRQDPGARPRPPAPAPTAPDTVPENAAPPALKEKAGGRGGPGAR